jgi:hypothetical protein
VTRVDLDYHRVTVTVDSELDHRSAAAAAAAPWYWQPEPPMLSWWARSSCRRLPTWPVSIPSGLGAKAGLGGPPRPRMPVGWEMNFKSQAARRHLKKLLGAASL